jgi:hypothetical protein
MLIYRPYTPSTKHIADNTISFNLRNGGQTPAYNVSLEASFYYANYGKGIPSGFTYPIINGPEPLFGGSVSSENPIVSIGPSDTLPSEVPIHPTAIPEIIGARQHDVGVFFYGNIRYTDVFKKYRITPFCFEYLPDNPKNEQFANCEEHNTPPEGG